MQSMSEEDKATAKPSLGYISLKEINLEKSQLMLCISEGDKPRESPDNAIYV